MYCNVLVTRPFDQTFTYKIKANSKVKLGSVVSVSFGKKKDQLGVVFELIENIQTKHTFKIKEIDYIYEDIFLNENILKYIDWISDYTLSPKGLVLKLFLVNKNIINHKITNQNNNLFLPKLVELNKEQKKAYNIIEKLLFKKTSPIVLEGVTGSGKTEVYFEVVEKIFKAKKQTLIMLPEISLTPQLESRFKERFGFNPYIWHSKISEKKRKNIWHQCYSGDPIIVVGARSSLFLPFNNLGLIIVDEEHDLSFKQEDNLRYQARDLAIVRSKIENFNIILSSATPSLETQNNINNKKFYHVFLSAQFSGLDLPKIELIDLQKEKLEKNNWISKKVFFELKNCIEKGEQALLFLNRRGYSPLSVCEGCGYRYHCNHCTSWLVMHQKKNRLLCHHCGTIYPIEPVCPICNQKKSLRLIGPGIERLAEEVKKFFPKYKIEIMSSDNANTPIKIKKIIENFDSKKIDILVATQIMAKGYHFANLSLVAVIDADAGLVGGDVRAIERTYNLLQQVGGRAGRSKQSGKVLIQTYYPNQPIMKSIKNRDRKDFIFQCLYERKQFDVPPFTYMTAIIVSGSSKIQAESYSNSLSRAVAATDNIKILGPVEAPLHLLRGKYRYRLLLKGKSRKKLNEFTRNLIQNCPIPNNLRLLIDVDPYTFN